MMSTTSTTRVSRVPLQSQEVPMAIQRMILMMTACATLVLSGVTAAIAHPRLVRATPAVGSTVATAPSEITLRFNEKLESAFSSVGVRDAAGNKVDKSDAKLDKGNRAILKVSLQPLTPGVYKVEWQAAGSDMHKVEGDFTFVVGK